MYVVLCFRIGFLWQDYQSLCYKLGIRWYFVRRGWASWYHRRFGWLVAKSRSWLVELCLESSLVLHLHTSIVWFWIWVWSSFAWWLTIWLSFIIRVTAHGPITFPFPFRRNEKQHIRQHEQLLHRCQTLSCSIHHWTRSWQVGCRFHLEQARMNWAYDIWAEVVLMHSVSSLKHDLFCNLESMLSLPFWSLGCDHHKQ